MADPTLSEIRARVESATAGPWEVVHGRAVRRWRDARVEGAPEPVWLWSYVPQDRPTAEFIAHARTDVPHLLALLDQARELLEHFGAPDDPVSLDDRRAVASALVGGRDVPSDVAQRLNAREEHAIEMRAKRKALLASLDYQEGDAT